MQVFGVEDAGNHNLPFRIMTRGRSWSHQNPYCCYICSKPEPPEPELQRVVHATNQKGCWCNICICKSLIILSAPLTLPQSSICSRFCKSSPNYLFTAGPARPYCSRASLAPLSVTASQHSGYPHFKPHCTAHRRDRFPPPDHPQVLACPPPHYIFTLRAGEAFIASPLALLKLCP